MQVDINSNFAPISEASHLAQLADGLDVAIGILGRELLNVLLGGRTL
jgi:hypothetical protein